MDPASFTRIVALDKACARVAEKRFAARVLEIRSARRLESIADGGLFFPNLR
jgi:hypothetical protein